MVRAAVAALLLQVTGCGHDADIPAAAATPVATTADDDDGPCGASHRDAAIARAIAVADRLRPGQLDLHHPGAHFSMSTLPGSNDGPVRCWTIVFPSWSGAVMTMPASSTAPAVPPGHAPEYRSPETRPITRDTIPAAQATAARVPATGMTRFDYPGQAGGLPVAVGPAGTHALGTAVPEGPGQPARMQANGGVPMLLASPAGVHAAPPLATAGPGAGPGLDLASMQMHSGMAPALQVATSYAPPPFIVFVLVDGRTLTAPARM